MPQNQTLQITQLTLSSPEQLTLADRRLYNYLLHEAWAKLPKQLSFEIQNEELNGIYGSGRPPIERLQQSLRRLARIFVEYELQSEGQPTWSLTHLLESCQYDVQAGKLYYAFSAQCANLLSEPAYLEKCLIQAHFTYKYSNLLYDILASAHFRGEMILSIEVTELRDHLKVESHKLLNFSDFNRFVLQPAVEEINAHASFASKYSTQRKGMKVTHVIFEMTPKRNISTLASASQIIPEKRPRLFIEEPEQEKLYAYLLNAETKERERLFALAQQKASQQKIKIDPNELDRPDLWFKWVMGEV